MGSSLAGSYRLVYFQPVPEYGERVCIALVFNGEKGAEVLYDPTFSKLKCLAPQIEPEAIKIYLETLSDNLKSTQSDPSWLIHNFTPQMILSEPRKSAWPLNDTARNLLINRYLISKETHITQPVHQKEDKKDEVRIHLRNLVDQYRSPLAELQEGAKTPWVLGRKIRRIAPVAVGLRVGQVVVLVDGIDLSVLTPKSALNRIQRVTHTFWQYKTIRQMGFYGQIPRRIGVVLNGNPNPSDRYKDVHAFALHEFTAEADIAVDSSSPDGLKRFGEALHRLVGV